jgi:hypothetical protein
MLETPLLPQTPLQRPIAQMALDLAASLEEKAQQAPLGGILDACESLLLDRGRQFLRDALASTLQQQIDQSEKKGAPLAPVLVDRPAATRGLAPVPSSPPSVPSACCAPISAVRNVV